MAIDRALARSCAGSHEEFRTGGEIDNMRQGPLTGVRILEFAGLGPAPFCGMLLSDLGADVVRIDRKGTQGGGVVEVTKRGRRSVALDLKSPAAVDVCLDLMEKADGLIEGFRPGVMERLGIGPDPALARNPKLVYGRMTGWGQFGPLNKAAGHDLNYIALSGALHAIGPAEKPVVPLNLVGDFGGGALYLAFGMLAGILHARDTGQGQVIDCAMTDGAASLMAMFYGFRAEGFWKDARGANFIDGGSHFYRNYQCADGLWIAVGSLEPQFYALLLEKLDISDPAFLPQMSQENWPLLTEKLATIFAGRTRAEWQSLLEGTDVCFAPVLSLDEAPSHPHNVARETFVELAGVVQPAPAPRFSATPGAIQFPPAEIGEYQDEALADWGLSSEQIAAVNRM
jgi:alpha-methylacyl-CoA racemase